MPGQQADALATHCGVQLGWHAGTTTSPSAAASDDSEYGGLAPVQATGLAGARAHWQVHLSRSMMLRRDSVSRADMASRVLTYMRTRSTAGMRNWSLAERT